MLGEACWSATLLHHHHVGVLLLDGVFPNLSLSLAGSRHGRRHRAARVLNAEAPLFGAKIGFGRDLNRYVYDSSNRILVTLPTRDLQGYEDALPSLSFLVTP